eukprot:gene5845-9466_t
MDLLVYKDGDPVEVDPAWLSEKIGKRVLSAKVTTAEKMGGMSGEFKFLNVVTASESDAIAHDTLALAAVSNLGSDISPEAAAAYALGFTAGRDKATLQATTETIAIAVKASEAFFYNLLASKLKGANVPACYYAEGSLETGEMLLLLECCTNADSVQDMCKGNPGAEEVTSHAFELYANLHATYWKDSALLDLPWLRASEWMEGDGQASWKAAQEMSTAIENGTSAVQWDPHLVACLDASYGKVDFEAYTTRMKATEQAELRLIDFEMVGLGPPGQELGQHIISHMAPTVRRRCENQLVKDYHSELSKLLAGRGMADEAAAYTFDVCWDEYIAGGVGRWAWFIPFFFGVPPMAQFFQDQLAAFLHDHVKDPATTPMPRV